VQRARSPHSWAIRLPAVRGRIDERDVLMSASSTSINPQTAPLCRKRARSAGRDPAEPMAGASLPLIRCGASWRSTPT
jgi:hypothetical protein